MGSLINASANHITAQAKIDAARITQKSGNAKQGAISELGRFSQSLGNSRRMDAAGKQAAAITENLARNLDSAAAGKLSMRIQAAEELGASVADAAAAGVGGSSIEQYNATLSLSNAIAEEAGDRAVNSENIAAGKSIADNMEGAVAGLGNDVILANQDYSQYVDHQKQGLFSRITTMALAAGATYLGGPSAGMAVLQANEAVQQSKNGDFAGSSQSLTGAFQSGMAGVTTYRSGGDGTHFGSAWGKQAFSRNMGSVKTK